MLENYEIPRFFIEYFLFFYIVFVVLMEKLFNFFIRKNVITLVEGRIGRIEKKDKIYFSIVLGSIWVFLLVTLIILPTTSFLFMGGSWKNGLCILGILFFCTFVFSCLIPKRVLHILKICGISLNEKEKKLLFMASFWFWNGLLVFMSIIILIMTQVVSRSFLT